MRQRNVRKSGYSLLELSIVLVILALVISSGTALLSKSVERDRINNTHEELKQINEALKDFASQHSRLPCPARRDVARGDAEFGREATDCSDSSPPSGMRRVENPSGSGKYVRIGGVPFYSLGLSDKYMDDDWDDRYLYAVSESMISTIYTDSTGNITLVDHVGNNISNEIAAVVLSHGKNQQGAYSRMGSVVISCNAANRDNENCDNDGIFMDALYNDSDVVPAEMFDDLITWTTRPLLFSIAPDDTSAALCEGGDVNEEFGGHCYMFIYNATNDWPSQKLACEALGGYLTTITSSAENSFILGVIVTLTHAGPYAIGINDEAVEGSYVWAEDGSALGPWNNWPTFPPLTTSDMEDYGVMLDSGQWGLYPPDYVMPAVCEKSL